MDKPPPPLTVSESSANPRAPAEIVVHVSGTLRIPLESSMLESLREMELEDLVLRESVKLAVAEKLGGFDRLEVHLDCTSSPTTAHVDIPLEQLGDCILHLQSAFDRMVLQAKKLENLLEVVKASEKAIAQSSASGIVEASEKHDEKRDAAQTASSSLLHRVLREAKRIVSLMVEGLHSPATSPTDDTAPVKGVAQGTGPPPSATTNPNEFLNLNLAQARDESSSEDEKRDETKADDEDSETYYERRGYQRLS